MQPTLSAANQAIKSTDTEFILMFQADGIIDQGDISKLLEAHKKYDNSFIVSPTLFDKDKNPSVNSGCFPEKELEKTTFILDGDICAETVLGSIMMFKKQDIMEIGLYVNVSLSIKFPEIHPADSATPPYVSIILWTFC